MQRIKNNEGLRVMLVPTQDAKKLKKALDKLEMKIEKDSELTEYARKTMQLIANFNKEHETMDKKEIKRYLILMNYFAAEVEINAIWYRLQAQKLLESFINKDERLQE
jgi:hypothetical protein